MMAYEESGMFDSGDSDVREYNAAFFAEYFSTLAHNGVYTMEDNLRVYADGTQCGVYVKPGKAWINGYYYALKADDDGDYLLTLNTADTTNPRIDRVVVRLDVSDAVRTISLAVLTGTPAASPTAPALTRSGNTWELALADVTVTANSTTVAASGVADKRADAELCGVMGHKADKTIAATGTLTVAGWTGASAPYAQTVTGLTGVTASSIIAVGLANSATDAQFEDAANAMLRPTAQAAGSVTIKAMADKPTLALPIVVHVFG